MTELYSYCAVWDLEAEGLDHALGRLAGEIGVDAICVFATHPGIYEIRPRLDRDRRAFTCNAAAHFQPETKRYSGTRIRPHTADWLKHRNPLERVGEAAERHRLRLRVAVSACRGDSLVEHHPHAACVNVFGDPIGDRLCPANADAREYVGCLVEDLTLNYPVSAVELSDADFGSPAFARTVFSAPFKPTDLDLRLMSWCFCAACRQRALDAGVNPEVVRSTILERLEERMDMKAPVEDSFDGLTDAHPEVGAYQQMREETVASLVRAVRMRSKSPLWIRCDGSPGPAGVKPSSLHEGIDGFVLPFHGTAPSEDVGETVRAAGGPNRICAALACCPPQVTDAPTLVAAVHRLVETNYAAVGFEDDGLMPQPCLDWLRQAVRYARREAT